MHIFTSVTANYIPKARVLAKTVKAHNPDSQFHLLLSDKHPDWLDITKEQFDSIINIDELSIPNKEAWIFKHSVVELCTAVKGFGFQEIIRRYNPDKVIYLDPDIAVMSTLDSLSIRLDEASIILTPHQTEPDTDFRAIIDNEICSLKHGVYNLGFLGVRNSPEGRRFVDWWANRLHHFCYDDIPNGLFTDQRWIDLAPAFFDDLQILRDPVYNVCTWNLSHRKVWGKVPDELIVNGERLCFYHFSGFDSGAQEIMLDVYGKDSPILRDLRDWYINECREMDQDQHGTTPCVYDYFSDGSKVTKAHRRIYRGDAALPDRYPNPFDTSSEGSYQAWFKQNMSSLDAHANSEFFRLQETYKATLRDLNAIRNSKSWRILKRIGIAKI